ncbi:MAG: hypothetical protein ACRYG6_02725 [Janthinobacterium lividum]
MTDRSTSSLVIPEYPSPDKQRLTMALRAFSALANGNLDEAEQCLDALSFRPAPATSAPASGSPLR